MRKSASTKSHSSSMPLLSKIMSMRPGGDAIMCSMAACDSSCERYARSTGSVGELPFAMNSRIATPNHALPLRRVLWDVEGIAAAHTCRRLAWESSCEIVRATSVFSVSLGARARSP